MRGTRIGLLLPAVSCVIASGVAAAPAVALSPAVATKAATSTAGSTATLNGSVNPNGLETNTYFEYGTTTSYGSKTAEVNAGSGSSTAEFAKSVSGLSSGTTYHFRIVATNADGTGIGVDKTFTAGAPEVKTLSASGITRACSTLKASVTSNGAPAKYQFDYGTTTSYGSTIPTTPKELSGSATVEETLCGLEPNTLYHYRIRAENSYGSAQGTDMTFTTLAAVTLSAKGTPLKAAAPLKVFSSKFTFTNSEFSHSCEENEFTGEVTENPGSLETVTAPKLQNAGGASCTYWPIVGFKVIYTISSKPTLEYTINGSGEGIAKMSNFVLAGKIAGQVYCEWNVALSGTYNFNQPLEVKMAGEAKVFREKIEIEEEVEETEGGGLCFNETLSGSFTVTSSGNSVEASH